MKQSEKPHGLQSYKRPRRGRPRPLHRAVASPGSEKTKRTGMCEGHLISYLYFTILWWPCIYFFSYFSRAGGEDDFELFLANVKARSLKTTARLREGICNVLVYRKPYQPWLHFVRIASLILVAFLLEERKISVPPLPRQRGLTLVAICSKCYIFLTLGDGQSSNSSGQTTTHSKDRSQADGSSLDLEWEHEDGTGVTDQVSFIIKSPSSH